MFEEHEALIPGIGIPIRVPDGGNARVKWW
jgi:hypothetical protein